MYTHILVGLYVAKKRQNKKLSGGQEAATGSMFVHCDSGSAHGQRLTKMEGSGDKAWLLGTG